MGNTYTRTQRIEWTKMPLFTSVIGIQRPLAALKNDKCAMMPKYSNFCHFLMRFSCCCSLRCWVGSVSFHFSPMHILTVLMRFQIRKIDGEVTFARRARLANCRCNCLSMMSDDDDDNDDGDGRFVVKFKYLYLQMNSTSVEFYPLLGSRFQSFRIATHLSFIVHFYYIFQLTFCLWMLIFIAQCISWIA